MILGLTHMRSLRPEYIIMWRRSAPTELEDVHDDDDDDDATFVSGLSYYKRAAREKKSVLHGEAG